MWTNNTTTQAAVTKRKSKDFWVNEEWKRIQRLLTVLSCDIVAKRVSSKGNVADELSRGSLGHLNWFEEVRVEVPSDLEFVIKPIFPPVLDV